MKSSGFFFLEILIVKCAEITIFLGIHIINARVNFAQFDISGITHISYSLS